MSHSFFFDPSNVPRIPTEPGVQYHVRILVEERRPAIVTEEGDTAVASVQTHAGDNILETDDLSIVVGFLDAIGKLEPDGRSFRFAKERDDIATAVRTMTHAVDELCHTVRKNADKASEV